MFSLPSTRTFRISRILLDANSLCRTCGDCRATFYRVRRCCANQADTSRFGPGGDQRDSWRDGDYTGVIPLAGLERVRAAKCVHGE